jgi:hypothetical protein
MSLILFDPTESPNISPALSLKVTFVPNLEERTGADFVLSTWDAPVNNDALLWQHVERGVGFQLKRGDDLVASIFDRRMIFQLERMLKWWTGPWLLHHAEIEVKDGDLYLDGRKTKISYSAYLSTLRSWQRCGGSVLQLDGSVELSNWIDDELERMASDKGTRVIGKKQEKLLPLTPEEETLATFPGVGPMRAHALWEALPEHGARQSLLQALVWMTDGYVTNVSGFGRGIERAARTHLGVQEGERLWIEQADGWQKVNDAVEIKQEE